MKITLTYVTRSVLLGVLVGVIAGCSSYSSTDTGESWGSYKCQATSTDLRNPATGWATSQSRARVNAIAKCQSQSKNPTACQIADCHNE